MRLALLLLLLPAAAAAQGERALDSLRAADYHAVVAQLRAGETDVDYLRGRLAFAATPGYEPYDPAPRDQQVRLETHLAGGDPAAAALVADSLLAGHYLDLAGHVGAAVAHEALGDSARAAFHFAVFEGLVDSILDTASGRADDPFVVNRVDEEYIVAAVLGLRVVGQGLVECGGAPCDELTLEDAGAGEVTLYFDVSLPYGHMRRQLGR